MRSGFYIRLAGSNLKKNARLYVPQIFTGAGLVAVFYIMLTLYLDNRLQQVRGGNYLPDVMRYGTMVMGLLSVILLLYTNSFLMKQRQREFGLYHILGMEKRHVIRVLFWESVLADGSALAAGLCGGILLYKLCALLICRLLLVDSVLGFYYISSVSLIPAAVFFMLVYLVTFLLNGIRIAVQKPVELLVADKTGEKEPRVRWICLVLGLVSLGAGYTIALTTDNPLKALVLFFVAVILVIIGTYLLFLAGSIAFLKLLKSNRRYYYRKNHMIVVSGMLYRMKQNAVGLASIAILSTCVLVMISTTFSLYAGIEDTIKRQYPHQLSVHGSYEVSEDDYEPFPVEELASMVSQAAQEMDLGISYLDTQKYLSVTYLLEDGKFTMDRDYASDLSVMDKISICLFMTAEEYQEMTGTTLPLASGQVAVYSPSTNTQVMGSALVIDDMEFSNVVALDDYPIAMNTLSDASLVNNMYGIVVKDDAALEEIDRAQQEAYGGFASSVQYDVLVDFADQEAEAAVDSELNDQVIELARAYADAQTGERLGIGLVWNSKADATEYYYGLNGTLLFLGLLLSIVFLFSTALIIYYKQISEGYEDRERFQIMEKVGMSAGEVKATIRSQILQVFFSPLLVAAVHILVAFPILSSFLKVLFLSSNRLFAGCMVVAFGMFLFIYVLIYKATAKVYYQIIHS